MWYNIIKLRDKTITFWVALYGERCIMKVKIHGKYYKSYKSNYMYTITTDKAIGKIKRRILNILHINFVNGVFAEDERK